MGPSPEPRSFNSKQLTGEADAFLVDGLEGSSLVNLEVRSGGLAETLRQSVETKALSPTATHHTELNSIQLKNQQEINKLVCGSSFSATLEEPRRVTPTSKGTAKNHTQKINFQKNSASACGPMSRNSMLQELRDSAAKIVTDSKKRAKVTARKFADTGRTSRRSLDKFRSTISSRQEAARSPLDDLTSGDEGKSRKTITTTKHSKTRKVSSKKTKKI